MHDNGAILCAVQVSEVVVELEPLVGAFSDVVGLADSGGHGRIVRRCLDPATPGACHNPINPPSTPVASG